MFLGLRRCQPHNLFSWFRRVCDEELPDMTDRLLAAGCVWRDLLAPPPPTLTGREPRPGDEALRFVGGRRPVVEYAVAVAATEQPGLDVRRGVRVTGLVPGLCAIPGVPHVAAGCTLRTVRNSVPTWWSTRWAGARVPNC